MYGNTSVNFAIRTNSVFVRNPIKVTPKSQSLQLKRSLCIADNDKQTRYCKQNQLEKIKLKISQYLSQQQITPIDNIPRHKQKRNIRDYLNKIYYVKEKNSPDKSKRVIQDYSEEYFVDRNKSFSINQIKLKRKGGHPYLLPGSRRMQTPEKSYYKVLPIKKRTLFKNKIINKQFPGLQYSNQGDSLYLNYLQYQSRYENKKKKNIIKINEKDKKEKEEVIADLEPWQKGLQQNQFIDFH